MTEALDLVVSVLDELLVLVKDADNKIKGLRQVAVKAIHELFKSDECKGSDDEDEDEDNDDEDEGATTGTTNGTTSTTTTTTTVAISGTDAKAIADAAIKAMDDEVANLKTKLEAPAAAPATTNASNATNKGKSDDKSAKSNKGKGHSEGKSHNDD